jgi:Mutator-like transposase/Ulp1 protease family, C-terminal catalytic domain
VHLGAYTFWVKMSQYRGLCASCGCGRNSKRMQQYPQGYPIPDFFVGDLDHRSKENCRLCRPCYRQGVSSTSDKLKTPVSVGKVKTRRIGAPSPVERVIKTRNVRSGARSTLSIETLMTDRSQSARNDAVQAIANLPPSIQFETENFLSMVMKMRCDKEIDERFGRVRVCNGRLDIRKSLKEGQRYKFQLQCAECKNVFEFASHSETGLLQLSIGNERLDVKKDDLRKVLLVLLAGSSYKSLSIIDSCDGVMAESTFYRIQRFVCQGIADCCSGILKEGRVELKEKLDAKEKEKEGSGKWVASLNGAWSHRGWSARQHSFLIRGKDENMVVCAVVLTKKHVALVNSGNEGKEERIVHEGNYFGTSKGMEGEAFIKAVEELKEDGLIPFLSHVVSDSDSSVPSIIANTKGMEHLKQARDPGHYQKNFMRSLQDIFGKTSNYKGFPYRIGKFYMRCLKRAESMFQGHDEKTVVERKKHFDLLWKHALPHYTRQECPKSCPCNEFYNIKDDEALKEDDVFAARALTSLIDAENHSGVDENGNLEDVEVVVEDGDEIVREILEDDANEQDMKDESVKKRKEPKRWLDVGNAKERGFIEKMTPLFREAGDSASDVLFGLNTCMSECSNSRRLVFCRKDRFYYSSYEARSLISAVLENIERVHLYERLFNHFGLILDDKDEKSMVALSKQDERKAKDSERKKSREFKERQAVISKSRIAHNIAASQASHDRREERGYTLTKDKKLKSASFVSRRGKKSQQELGELYDSGIGNVKKCETCETFYTKSHKCKGHPPKGRKKSSKKRSRIVVEIPKDKGEEESDEDVGAVIAKKKNKGKKNKGATFDDDDFFDDDEILDDIVVRSASKRIKKSKKLDDFIEADELDSLELDTYKALREKSAKLMEKARKWVDSDGFGACVDLFVKGSNVPASTYVPCNGETLFDQLCETNLKDAKRRFKKAFENVKNKEKIILPSYRRSHYIVLVFKLKEHVVELYDSIPNYQLNYKEDITRLKTLLKDGFGGDWEIKTPKCPEQDNSDDCGVFALNVLRNLLLGYQFDHKVELPGKRNTRKPNKNKAEDVIVLRKQFAEEIRQEQLLPW